jgi:hypothetical protein
MIRQHYPDATFQIQRAPDEPDGIDLIATIDVDDTDDVMDVVIDRVMEMQIEDDLPVHVVPRHTPEWVAKTLEEQRRQRDAVLDVTQGT